MSQNKVPQHVAIIMDGNGRWAKNRSLPKIAGHHAGVKAAREAVKSAKEFGVKVLTLYTFSTENWKRPREEVDALFHLLEEYIGREVNELNKKNIRLSVIGNIEGLPESVQKKLNNAMESTQHNTDMVLNLALNYGSRAEIVDAVRNLCMDYKEGKIKLEDIGEDLISRYLYTRSLPDPDLLIRTSGESRVSNFLLWQIAYTELYVIKKLWPDFKRLDFKKAIAEYQKRERRYGG